MPLVLLLSAALASDYAEEAEQRMKLSFDLDDVQAELAAPAAAAPRVAYAPTPAPVAPRLPLEPNSDVERVLVLRDRAIVTRTRTLDLPAGTQRVRFEGLPLSLDATALAAEVRGGKGRVVGVELVSGVGDVEETERIEGIRKRAEALSGELGALRDGIEALLVQRAYLDRAVLSPGGESRPAPSLDVVKGTLGWLGEAERDLAAKLRASEEKAGKLGEELEPLLVKLRDPSATGLTVRVDVEMPAGGNADLALRYGVTGASWSPAYSARLDPDAAGVSFETQALVRQSTGELWKDARIELSTARPLAGGAAPELTTWVLDEYGVDPGSFAATGGASSGAGARVYAVDGRRTLAGDGSEARFPLASVSGKVALELDTVPRITPEVFRSGAFAWTAESPLLPGPVASFVGGDYVGSANIGAIAPGEPIELGFGVDDRLKAERTLVSRKVEHLLGGRTRTTVRFRTTVRNFGKAGVTVSLHDQVPVSQVDRITVALVETSLAPTAAEDAAPGVLGWTLQVPAGGVQSVDLCFSVTAPRELQSRMEQMLL
jgi:hypothetical protein